MPAAKRQILREVPRLLFPWGALMLVLACASMLYGSDRDSASLTFSAIILVLGGLALVLGKADVTAGAVLGGLALVAFAAGALLAGRFDTAASEYASLAAAGIVWMVARSGASKKERAGLLWQGTLLVGGLIAAYNFFDFTLSPTTLYGEPRPYHLNRLAGPFLSANTAGTFYGVIALMALAELWRKMRSGHTPAASGRVMGIVERGAFAAIIFALAVTCLILSASRGAIIFFASSALVFMAWELWVSRIASLAGGWRYGLSAVVGLVTIGLVFYGISGDIANSRFEYLDRDSDTRLALISAYWTALPLAPWFGHGLGGFSYANRLIADALDARLLLTQGAAHNVYLQWLLQGGILGSALMAAALIAQLRSIVTGLSRRRQQRTYLRATVCIALFVFLHGWVDYALEIPGFMWWFAWVLGLGCGLAAAGSGRAKT